MSANHRVEIAKVKKQNFETNINMSGGYCEVTVYRRNADGSSTLVGIWGGYADSQEACDAKGRSIIFQLEIGTPVSEVK